MSAHFKTWEDAREYLEDRRRQKIAMARYIAVEMAREHGEVHSRMIRPRLEALGLINDNEDERWIGPVFAAKNIFEWTGRRIEVDEASPRTRGTDGGGRPPRIWRLVSPNVRVEKPEKINPLPDLKPPQRPKPEVIGLALDDLRGLVSFVNKINEELPQEKQFKFEHLGESKQLGEWLRYIAAGFSG